MATHSGILAWRIPWTEEPGGLQSMGSQRVGHDLATSLSSLHFPSKEQVAFNFMASVTIHSYFGAKKIKSVTVSTFSLCICHKVMGLDAMILVFKY